MSSLTSGSLFQPFFPKLKVTMPWATWPSFDTWIAWLGWISVPSGPFAGIAPFICWTWSSWRPISARSDLDSPDVFS